MGIDECIVNGRRVFYNEIDRVYVVATSPDDLEEFATREQAHTYASNLSWDQRPSSSAVPTRQTPQSRQPIPTRTGECHVNGCTLF
jgi:hypothetical protein